VIIATLKGTVYISASHGFQQSTYLICSDPRTGTSKQRWILNDLRERLRDAMPGIGFKSKMIQETLAGVQRL
jgi:hypothetical protein